MLKNEERRFTHRGEKLKDGRMKKYGLKVFALGLGLTCFFMCPLPVWADQEARSPKEGVHFQTTAPSEDKEAWTSGPSVDSGNREKKKITYGEEAKAFVKNGATSFKDERGKTIRSAWIQKQEGRYFVSSQGQVLKGISQKVDQRRYYFNKNGKNVSGVQKLPDGYYYFDEDQENAMIERAGIISKKHGDYYAGDQGRLSVNEIISPQLQTDASGKLIPLGTYLPKAPKGAVLVVDLSKWNDPDKIDYDLLCKSISGVILRIGYTGHGTGVSVFKDTSFQRHYEAFQKRGIPIGGYWFSCATKPEDAINEAKTALSYMSGYKFQLPIYWDTEDEYHQAKVDRRTLSDAGHAFLQTIAQAGYKTGIYASTYWLNKKLLMDEFQDYETWVAEWQKAKKNGRLEGAEPSYDFYVTYQKPYGMWQFTEKLTLPGNTGRMDGNWMLIDYPGLLGEH